MKSLLFLLAISISLSGCLNLVVQGPPEYDNYPLYYKLEEISPTLPELFPLNQYVNLTITYPDGIPRASQRLYVTTRNPVFRPINHTLYQTGIYTAKYEAERSVYYDYFFAGTIDPRLVFNVTDFYVKNNEVYLKIANEGRIDGFVYISLYEHEPKLDGVKTTYNKNLIQDYYFIKNGHYIEEELSVRSPSLEVLVNGDKYISE